MGKAHEGNKKAHSTKHKVQQKQVGNAVSDNCGKLTKQQKRDLKRNAKQTSTKVEHTRQKSSSSDDTTSVSVYKRQSLYPTSSKSDVKNRFIVPSDGELFCRLLKTSYDGFVAQPSTSFSPLFHQQFNHALEALEKMNYYHFDYTQPAGLGTKIAKTFVSRCLVGDAGMTYKYLGLRMFAYPWNEGEIGSNEHTAVIGKMNQGLIAHTKKLLKESGKTDYGSCNYNLTLINRCFPEKNKKTKLKVEPLFGNEKCTVSWHADSSLEHYSSIAVYHCTRNDEAKQTSSPTPPSMDAAVKSQLSFPLPKEDTSLWRIALKVHRDAEGPNAGRLKEKDKDKDSSKDKEETTPPLAFPLPNEWSYFLLDDFNHHHQHSVLAGSSDRYASTHRVSRVVGHSFNYIHGRCVAVTKQRCKIDIKAVRSEQLVLDEVEFEWIRQFYIQGQTHWDLHTWWHEPMQQLVSFWEMLEERSLGLIVRALQDAATEGVEIEVEVEVEEGGDEKKQRKKEGNKERGKEDTKDMKDMKDTKDTVKEGVHDQKKEKKEKKMRKREAERRGCAAAVTKGLYDEMIQFLSERATKRQGWLDRETDAFFLKEPSPSRPLLAPSGLKLTTKSIASLLNTIQHLKDWRTTFLSREPGT